MKLEYLYDIGLHSREAVCVCRALVLWGSPGSLSSSIGLGKLTNRVSNLIKFPPHIQGVLVGLILSDAWIQFANAHNKNARLGFKQGLINFHYFWHVFILLSHYCSSYPHLISSVRNNKRSFGVGFQTRSLPCFTELHTLFYINGTTKIVPENIYELLTPIALAHWIMGDGTKHYKRVILCTDSYIIQDVVKLMNVLMVRYGLECTLIFHTVTQPRIVIRTRSMPLLRSIVLPHMHTSMHYKLNL